VWSAGGVVGLVAVALVACSSPEPDAAPEVGGAYTEVVEWFVDRAPTGSEPPVVFMESLGEGFEMDLGLQATIVAEAQERAQVRFIDERSDALGEAGEEVRDGGILLAVGPAAADGDEVTIDAEQFVSVDESSSWVFRLRADEDGAWTIVGAPAEAGP